jgi:putative sugar O-methyltransferase
VAWQPRLNGFLFSDASSALSQQEFDNINAILTGIEGLIARRQALTSEGRLDATAQPSGNWDPTKKQVYEIDAQTTSFMTSFALLMQRDYDILKKLRLYSQAFSGYQLATLAPAVHRPWIREKLPADYDRFLRMLVGNPDESVHKFVNTANKLPEAYRFSFPAKFGEIGWIVDDMVLSKDTWMYLERICLLHECGILPALIEKSKTTTVRIMEIGSGFGGLAYFLKRIIPNSRIVLIDLPESLAFCLSYLATVFPGISHSLVTTADYPVPEGPGFTYVSNYDAPSLQVPNLDLAINTLSMAEMEDEQIISYCKLIQRSLAPGAQFFEQNFGFSTNATKNLVAAISQVLTNPRLIQSAIIPTLEKGTPRLWSA